MGNVASCKAIDLSCHRRSTMRMYLICQGTGFFFNDARASVFIRGIVAGCSGGQNCASHVHAAEGFATIGMEGLDRSMGQRDKKKVGMDMGGLWVLKKMAPGDLNLRLRHLHGFDWG